MCRQGCRIPGKTSAAIDFFCGSSASFWSALRPFGCRVLLCPGSVREREWVTTTPLQFKASRLMLSVLLMCAAFISRSMAALRHPPKLCHGTPFSTARVRAPRSADSVPITLNLIRSVVH